MMRALDNNVQAMFKGSTLQFKESSLQVIDQCAIVHAADVHLNKGDDGKALTISSWSAISNDPPASKSRSFKLHQIRGWM